MSNTNKYAYKILSYFVWTVLAFLFVFGHMQIVLGINRESPSWLGSPFDQIYEFAFLGVVAIIASIIMLLYVMLDVFYLNKKLKNSAFPSINRLWIFITICMLVVVIHYVLEKVMDVI